jgi:hypothetical protein
MQLSNDVKWNKIQQIMKLIPDAVKFEMLYQYLEAVSHSDALKLVNRDTWILANQIYDVAVDGLEDMTECFNYEAYPHLAIDTINDVINLSTWTNRKPEWYLYMRDLYWEQYEYDNS